MKKCPNCEKIRKELEHQKELYSVQRAVMVAMIQDTQRMKLLQAIQSIKGTSDKIMRQNWPNEDALILLSRDGSLELHYQTGKRYTASTEDLFAEDWIKV